MSRKNVPGFSSPHGPELDLQNVPELNLLQQLCRMDDPGIKVEQVDNRVGQGGSEVFGYSFQLFTFHFSGYSESTDRRRKSKHWGQYLKRRLDCHRQ